MGSDQRLQSERFPRSSKYNPEWLMANGMGSHPTWLIEWLSTAMDLRPGMRVLDLGCGRASSSIFLAREFGVEVWATDLWISASENLARLRDAGVEDRVFPLHADARSLPYAGGFFDAITCVDAFSYFGTDDLYLNYLANFVKAGGQIGIAGAGLAREVDGAIPEHLRTIWTQDWWCLHSAAWWRRHWERTGIVRIETADAMEDGWKMWLEWQRVSQPNNPAESETAAADAGRYLAYVRMVGRREESAKLEEYCWPDSMKAFASGYKRVELMRDARTGATGR